MIKLIASDMDGTLIGNDREISKENIQAIKLAQSKGIHFAIATGRSYEDIKPFLDKYNLKCECISLNGSEYIDMDGNILESIYISKEKVREILNIMKEYNLSIELYTTDGYYTTNTREETFKGMLKRAKTFHSDIKDFDKIHEIALNHPHFIKMNYITNLEEFLNSNVKVSKFVSFAETVEEINEVKDAMNKLEGIAVSSSFITNIEINHEYATKGKLLQKVAEKMNIKKEEVAVFGDGSNDYSMISEFHNSFAMDNAIEEIKNAATYITDSNANHGVAKGIYKIIGK